MLTGGSTSRRKPILQGQSSDLSFRAPGGASHIFSYCKCDDMGVKKAHA